MRGEASTHLGASLLLLSSDHKPLQATCLCSGTFPALSLSPDCGMSPAAPSLRLPGAFQATDLSTIHQLHDYGPLSQELAGQLFKPF